MRMPRRRSVWRSRRLLYPLSPTNRLGRSRGRPGPARFTWPWFSRSRTTVASCCWPGVSTNVINLPWPSTRTWILVLNPPRLRPKASASAVLFLPPQRAGGHAPPTHPQNGCPSPTRHVGRPAPGARSAFVSTRRPYASAETDCIHWSISRSVPANRATVLLYAQPTASHSPSSDGHALGGLCSVFGVAASLSAAPIVRLLVRVVCSCFEYTHSLHEFAYTPQAEYEAVAGPFSPADC